MNTSRPTPSLVLSLIALVMASAGTGYAALGDGGGGAVTAGNSRGEPVEIQLRNRSRGETGLVTSSDGYALRLSNTKDGGGGGAVYGCRAPDAPPADNLACLYAENLRGGRAFLFRSRSGPAVGHFDLGDPAGPPFTTNATGLVDNLNADKVDGLDASQLQGQTGPQGPQGPVGPQGPTGVTGYEVIQEDSAFNSSSSRSLAVQCPAGKEIIGGGSQIIGAIGGIALSSDGPDSALDTWESIATEINAQAGDWGLIATVYCADVSP